MNTKEQVKQLTNTLRIQRGCSATPQEIQAMESKLNLVFPKEYKEFLETFGWLEPPAVETILGGGKDVPITASAVQETIELRENDDAFPKNCVAVGQDGGGNFYCVVCNGKDLGKVIFWQHDVFSGQVYPNNPKPEYYETNPDAPRQDFWDWLLHKLLVAKEFMHQ